MSCRVLMRHINTSHHLDLELVGHNLKLYRYINYYKSKAHVFIQCVVDVFALQFIYVQKCPLSREIL